MKHKPREKYSEDDVLRTIADIKNSVSTYRAASEKYHIPIATLSDKVKQQVPLSSNIGDFQE